MVETSWEWVIMDNGEVVLTIPYMVMVKNVGTGVYMLAETEAQGFESMLANRVPVFK